MTQTFSQSPGLVKNSSDARFFSRPIVVWLCIALTLLSFGVYANTLKNGFTLDDIAIVHENTKVLQLEWSQIWTSNYWPKDGGMAPDVLYRPLTIWSYLVNQYFAPDAAWAYHLVNVILHVFITLLTVLLTWKLFANRWIALLTGLIFAIHPLHTEVVANVVGRAELLGTLFSLLMLITFLPTTPLLFATGPQRRPWWHGFLVTACFMLAMLSKETPAALMFALPVIDWWRWSQWDKPTRPSLTAWLKSQAIRYYVPIVLAFVVYLLMRLNACGLLRDASRIHPVVNPLVDATFLERIVTPFALLAKYLQLSFWPSVLVADYSAPSLMPTANLMAPLPLLGFLVTILAIIAMVRLWKKVPQITLAIILFAFSYALVANFLRIGTILGERLFYLPSLFLIMIVSYCGYSVYRSLPASSLRVARWPAMLIVALLCGAMSYRTITRNTDWQSNLALAIATARDNPGSAKACFWAGTSLVYGAPTPQIQDFGEDLLHRAIELYPTYGHSFFELAKLNGRKNKLGQSLVYLTLAAEHDPGQQEIRFALAGIKIDLASHDPSQYMPDLERFAAEQPKDPAVNLGYGLAYASQGKLEKAQQSYEAAIKSDGRFHEAACELGLLLVRMNKIELGVNMLRQYVIQVSNTDARCDLAHALIMLDPQKFPTALAEAQMNVQRAQEDDPGNLRVRQISGEVSRHQKLHASTAEAPGVLSPVANLPVRGQP